MNIKSEALPRLTLGIGSGVNLLALVGGVVYLCFPSSALGWNLVGSLWVLATLANLFCMHRSVMYYLVSAGALLLLPLVNTIVSSLGPHALAWRFLAGILAYLPLAWALSRNIGYLRGWGPKPRTIRLIWPILVGLVWLIGVYLALRMDFGRDNGLLGVMGAQISFFWGLAFVAIASLGGRFSAKFWQRVGLAAASALLCLLCALPLLAIPWVVAETEASFAPGGGTRKVAFPEGQSPRLAPFNLMEYILADGGPTVSLVADIPYYQGTLPKEAGLQLHFDAWLPPPGLQPSARPVLIRIHGGAWVSGDKGLGNMPQINRHFARQGYVVFDLQYGLNNQAQFKLRAPTPAGLMGDYAIEDMQRHLVAFTRYLADHAAEYQVDPRAVFVSGNSAGGHLAATLALSGNSGWRQLHPDLAYDPRLKILGLIAFYPAIAGPASLGIAAGPEMNDPSLLVDSESPPSLVYQGAQDGMVKVERTECFLAAYNQRSGHAARAHAIVFPFAGHGSDLNFAVPFNQVFIYYMERFMRDCQPQN